MLYDILLALDGERRIQEVSWGSEGLRELYSGLFEEWATSGRGADDVFELPEGAEEGDFLWEENRFFFRFLAGPEGRTWLLLKQEDLRPYLLARSLDQITDGVQIYDRNACVV